MLLRLGGIDLPRLHSFRRHSFEIFNEAPQGIHNVAEQTRKHVQLRLNNVLELLEQLLPLETQSEMTPPNSDHRSRSRKRKPTLDVERTGHSALSLRTSFSARGVGLGYTLLSISSRRSMNLEILGIFEIGKVGGFRGLRHRDTSVRD